MLSTRTAIAALTTLAALAAPLTGANEAFASAKKGKALTHTGYRILIEPEVTESSRKHRGLTTKSITWKLFSPPSRLKTSTIPMVTSTLSRPK